MSMRQCGGQIAGRKGCAQNSGKRCPHVAVMGCAVNGPGEAKGADVALCGGDGEFLLYVHGQPVRKVPPSEAVAAVLATLPFGTSKRE